jgi:hypothetical protein
MRTDIPVTKVKNALSSARYLLKVASDLSEIQRSTANYNS